MWNAKSLVQRDQATLRWGKPLNLPLIRHRKNSARIGLQQDGGWNDPQHEITEFLTHNVADDRRKRVVIMDAFVIHSLDGE